MDVRLVNGAVCQVVGPSGSGKTHFVINLLSNSNVFREPTRQIYWLMRTDEGESGDTQKQFKLLKKLKSSRVLKRAGKISPKKVML